MSKFGLIQLKPQFHERIWGGQNLRDLYDMSIPPDRPIGEAWLVSDHPGHESVVVNGARAGRNLHDLINEDPQALLGARAQLTVHGRFPLLLKVLDANDVLSVQVHPDDDTAQRLHEPDVGKTEMWHVLHCTPYSELICGLYPSVTRESFTGVVDSNRIEDLMVRFRVEEGTSVFVPAGTVHAIGAGIVLAEIQQNSDITYRLYDWQRVGPNGQPRDLHIEKALESIHFGSNHGGANRPLAYSDNGATRSVLAACRYFAAELVDVPSGHQRHTRADSFHIVLDKTGALAFQAAGEQRSLQPGQALIIPGDVDHFSVEGQGSFLDYYVPDLFQDIVAPLQKCGCSKQEILRLGGDPGSSDLNQAFTS